jgi:hypothetical protein
MRALGVALAYDVLAGCRGEDARFSTPEATIATLFRSYGVDRLPESAVRARLAARAKFTLRDAATYERCFADFHPNVDDGVAGFVFGRLVSAKDHLAFSREGDAAAVRLPGDESAPAARVVLRDRGDGFRIVLAETVPANVAAQLRAIERRARETMQRSGAVE